jgi:phenylacetate-CoA ligase
LDLYPVRLVDPAGKEAPLGDTGEVIISNLVNRGTVLLNYRLGDLAAFRPEPCPCGRSLPLLSLEGRTNDVIRLPSGRELNPMAFLFIFRLATEIWQAQIVQRTLDSLEVRLVPRDNCNREETGARVAGALRQVLKEDLRVEVLFVDHMERTPAGKVRVVLSLLPPAPGEEPER